MNELKRHFVSTWVLRDDFTADAQRVPALPPGHANVAKNMLEAFVFPVTCVVCLNCILERRCGEVVFFASELGPSFFSYELHSMTSTIQ
jgi:hypothetical protein